MAAVGAGYLGLVLCLGYLYGLILGDRSLPLITVAGIDGWVECLKDGLDPCTYIGYPEGVRLSLSTSVVYGAHLLGALGIDTAQALDLIALLCLAAGLAALWYLTYRVTSSHMGGALASFLYYGSPMLVGHIGLVSIFYGFLLLPVPVLVAYLLVSHSRRLALAALYAACLFLLGFVMIYADPYPFVIATTCVSLVLAGGTVWALVSRAWGPAAVMAGAVIVAWLPTLVYRTLEAGSGLEIIESQDFYRAEGADIGTMFVPTHSQWIGRLLHVPVDRWDTLRFYGNHTHLTAPWFGPILLVTAVVGAVLLFRRRSRRWIAIGLGLVAAGCFVAGLGPSLKLLDRASEDVGVDNYYMPAEHVTATFPWAGAYGRQPLASMRYVYRWHVGLRLAGAVLGAAAVVALAERKKALAIGLAALLVLETTPQSLLSRRHVASNDADMRARFDADIDRTFRTIFQPGERVLFLPVSNDYLIQDIAPRYRLNAYNIAFDKEITRIKPLQPEAIVQAEADYDAGELRGTDVCRLFRADLLDTVVFSEFYLRWNAYWWPPTLGDREWLSGLYELVDLTGDPRFDIQDRGLAVIVRPKPGGPCEPAPASPRKGVGD